MGKKAAITMKREKVKRESIWSGKSPYGTYTGPRGSADQWRAAFREVISPEEAEKIVGSDSPWAILGIPVGSAFDVIKSAWRKMALLYHPDRHPPDKKKWAEENFIKCQAAYVKLSGR